MDKATLRAMPGTPSAAARRRAIVVVLGAQVALLIGIVLFASGSDWTASSNGLFTVLGGSVAVVVGTLTWWAWGIRAPLVMADLWLGIYGTTVAWLFGAADYAEPGPSSSMPLVLGLLWMIGGLGGAIAVWRSRR